MAVVVTPDLVKKIYDIIELHHGAVAAALYGPDTVPQEYWDKAVSLGIVTDQDTSKYITRNVHVFGSLVAHLEQSKWQDRYGSTAASLLKEVKNNPVPRTEVEVRSSLFSRRRGAENVVGLGKITAGSFVSMVVDSDITIDEEIRSTIKDLVSAKFGDNDAQRRLKDKRVERGLDDKYFDEVFRSSVKQVASMMEEETKERGRDFDRIAFTEIQRSFQEGIKESWKAQEEELSERLQKPIDRIIVYKVPAPTACKHCNAMHLGPSGRPRLYYLEDLEANGTNYGKKASEWSPVVGPVHPYCSCLLLRYMDVEDLPSDWKSGDEIPAKVHDDEGDE